MRILIADDHEVIRSSVIRVLQARGDVEECAEATNGREAVEKAVEWKPDLILLDIRLPVLSGFDAAKEIKQQAPHIPVLLFSIDNSEEILEQARRLAADLKISTRTLYQQVGNQELLTRALVARHFSQLRLEFHARKTWEEDCQEVSEADERLQHLEGVARDVE